MKIFVTAKPGAKQVKVEQLSPNIYKVWVREPAKDGRANQALIEVLAKHFGVAKSQVLIRRGLKNKKKLIEIL